MVRSPRPLIFALFASSLLVACDKYTGRASEIAHAEVDGADMVRRDGTVAYTLCRDEASYAYLEMRLGIGRAGPVASPPTFPSWYESEQAARTSNGEKISWRSYCESLDTTGVVYHNAVLVLRDYGTAIESLSDAKDFDGSGLASAGEGAGSAGAALLHVEGIDSTAAGVGSAASTASTLIVGFIRSRELRKLIERGAPAARAVVDALVGYLDALENERKVVASHRDDVIAAIGARRDEAGGFAPAAESAIAFDLTIEGDRRLVRFEHHIASDRQLLANIGKALDALSRDADSHCETRKAAETLRRAVDEAKRERPEDL